MKYIFITLLSFTFATQITTRFKLKFTYSNSGLIIQNEISGLSNGKTIGYNNKLR